MKNPITPEGAASAQNPLPPVPTTKMLAISHVMGTPMAPSAPRSCRTKYMTR